MEDDGEERESLMADSDSSPNPPAERKSKRASILDDVLLVNSMKKWAKLATGFTAIWIYGWLAWSFLWIWVALALYVWRDRHVKAKDHRARISQEIARDEKSVILARVEDLPSWVNFSDVERAEWINKMIRQLWPFIGAYVEKMMRESVEPNIRNNLPSSLQSFKFTTIDLGDIPPRVGGVKVYTGQRRDEMHMDLELNYSSDSDVAVSIKGIQAGLKNFILHGTLRVVFKPLMNQLPLIGGMRIFFLNNPTVEFTLTSVASAFDLPGLSDMLHAIVQEQISHVLVLPNCIPVKLADGIDLSRLKYPQPEGVIRVKVIEAKDLLEADIAIFGEGTSDPYVILKVGSREVRTSIKPKTLNPVWNETFEMVVDAADGQRLFIDVLDDDQGSKDDELGRVDMDLTTLKEVGFEDQWLPLENVETGMIHLELTWLWLANDPTELDKMTAELHKSMDQEQSAEEDRAHVAMLMVYIDSAANLPRSIQNLTEPSPQVKVTVGHQVFNTKVKVNTNEPCWEENFRFMLQNPAYQDLDVEIIDTKCKRTMGKKEIHIRDLIDEDSMTLDQKFYIKTTQPNSYITMRLALRVLTPRADPKWTQNEEDLEFIGAVKEKLEDGAKVDKPDSANSEPHGGSSKKQEDVKSTDSDKLNQTTESSTTKVISRQESVTSDTKQSAQLTKQASIAKETKQSNGENGENHEEPVRETFQRQVSNNTTEQAPKPDSHGQLVDLDEADRAAGMEEEDEKDGATLKFTDRFNANVDSEAIARSIKASVVDETAIMDILAQRSQQQRYDIALTYAATHQKDLSKDLFSKLKGKIKNMCVELLQSPAEMDAKALNRAMKGIGCNDQVLVEIIFTRTNEQLSRIKDAYKKLYEKDLEKEVASETKGEFENLLLNNLHAKRPEGSRFNRNKARNDAKVLAAADKKTWVKRDSVFMTILLTYSYAQLRATFQEYARYTGTEVGDVVHAGMSGDTRKGVLAILEIIRGKAKYFAHALHKSMKGLGTDDDTLVRIVASRCEVDMVQIKEEFFKEYKQSLGNYIADDTSGDYRKLLLALIGDQTAANGK